MAGAVSLLRACAFKLRSTRCNWHPQVHISEFVLFDDTAVRQSTKRAWLRLAAGGGSAGGHAAILRNDAR